jgi:hypothetical protein
VPFLVRKLDRLETGPRRQLTEPAHTASLARRNSDDGLPEMGYHHPHNHAGRTERDSLGLALHISVEAYQPNREGKARQRISPLDRGFDVGQQISR